MITLTNIIFITKYVIATALLIGVIMAPAWIARQNKKGGLDMGMVRLIGWLLWWTFVGWLFALFWAAKK